MAKKDRVNILGRLYETINLSGSVGAGGKNQPDDVMLVQALFRFIAFRPDATSRLLGLLPGQVPEVTGVCDLRTQAAIWAFQRTNSGRLLNLDGLIHPASYENRRLDRPTGRLMAITLLGGFAVDAALMRSLDQNGVVEAILEFEPRLRQALA